jgi:hypothetical protein
LVHNHDSSINKLSSTQVESSSLILSVGAPSFGGGQSFETLDFSLPSYDQAVSGGDVVKPAAKETPKDDGAAKAAEKAAKEEAAAAERAAKEDARRAAAEKKEGALFTLLISCPNATTMRAEHVLLSARN